VLFDQNYALSEGGRGRGEGQTAGPCTDYAKVGFDVLALRGLVGRILGHKGRSRNEIGSANSNALLMFAGKTRASHQRLSGTV
jgi:hypothetical protein